MTDLLAALLLGIIEGITEFLPISSTGHLLIAEHWLGRRSDLFNIVIQAGAILAVVLIYRQRLWQLAARGLARARHDTRDYALKLARRLRASPRCCGLVVKKLGWELPETVHADRVGADHRRRLDAGRPNSWRRGARRARRAHRDHLDGRGAGRPGAGGGRRVSRAPRARRRRSSSPCWPAPPTARRRPSSRSWSASRPCSPPPATSCSTCSGTAACASEDWSALARRLRRLGDHRLRRGEVAAALHPDASLHRVRGLSHRARRRAVAAGLSGRVRGLFQSPPCVTHSTLPGHCP